MTATSSDGFTVIGPLAYRGKRGCKNVTCTHIVVSVENGRPIFDEACRGWHCSYCDAPCSYQGHRCDAAEAVLGEARRIAHGPDLGAARVS